MGKTEPTDAICVRGARVHNLNGVDIDIPRGKFTVITGLSGSGKSSLAFDTIYAEGQRRYVESLSSYARQFLGMMEKPEVESITGLSPAISIEQKTVSHNPRSTVGTVTEVHDYLRLLFARAGTPHCPIHHKPLQGQRIDQIVTTILNSNTKRLMLLAPVIDERKGEHVEVFSRLGKRGFVRLRVDGKVYDIEEVPDLALRANHTIEIVIDRLKPKASEKQRLLESVEVALEEGDGRLRTLDLDTQQLVQYSAKQACPVCAYAPPELEPKLFSFNSTNGACPTCNGLGEENVFEPITDPTLSLNEGAFPIWSPQQKFYFKRLRKLATKLNFSLSTPFNRLSKKAQQAFLHGIPAQGRAKAFEGAIPWLQRRWREADSQFMRDYYSRFMVTRKCQACNGDRLRPEARAVLINEASLPQIARLSLHDCHEFFTTIKLDADQAKIATRILREVIDRVGFLVEVGLGYLSLGRAATTLSGGENQRIRLASQVGSGLTGVTYVLDEPSIGLHAADNDRLLNSLERLRDLGNTVIVVEHDEEAIRRADHVVDMGPGAGRLGGNVVSTGTAKQVSQAKDSYTGDYLSGRRKIAVPKKRHQPDKQKLLQVVGAAGNNLQELNVDFPLGLLICVTGVSGSGKSTLVADTLHKAVATVLNNSRDEALVHERVDGIDHIDKIIDIDQSPIGRTPRSNPATYTGLFTPLRQLFAELPLSRERGYNPGHFSFNVAGGRCDACDGDGVRKVEMHFLPDVFVTCTTCQGKRYKEQTLECRFRGKSIHDVLSMTVDEGCEFFANQPLARRKLETLAAVGLGYIRLGQPAPTLSGGEAQRVKLALELSKVATGRTLYLLDEPTTGLHFHDIAILIKVLERLRDAGNTVIVVEHNIDVIKTADYLIDLGPGGGNQGGNLVACGTPEKVAKTAKSLTGKYLKAVLPRTN